ncbi:hypothetical protein Q9Q94_08055 [Uliginosibacterium sp. 31-16]|uniref:hypothetical protein n=1 Tax=Uliginosibacterium sp. 31-16 TaxID=3068315 RepID=UPI00273F24C0|nr:hypothetical protein [Uliginosibacterium sp. 31-16]MDP5239479.1 hypothetical protein [Uliginosibacterium sp. 31-16]
MKTRNLTLSLIAALSLALLSACSIAPYEGKYRHEDGWRKARVRAVGSLERLESTSYTCPQADKADKKTPVAVVSYQGGGRLRTQLMLLSDKTDQKEKADKADFKVDDLVYANIKQCAEPMIPRKAE